MIISVDLSKSQQATMRRIMKSGNSGKVRLTKQQLTSADGEHLLKLSVPQARKVMSAINRQKGLDLEFSKNQIVSMAHEQRAGFFFLPFLVTAAEAAAPYVASAVGGYVADKAIGWIGDKLFGGDMMGEGYEMFDEPMVGGAGWYESGKGEHMVCFDKTGKTKGKIKPKPRGKAKGKKLVGGAGWYESTAGEHMVCFDKTGKTKGKIKPKPRGKKKK